MICEKTQNSIKKIANIITHEIATDGIIETSVKNFYMSRHNKVSYKPCLVQPMASLIIQGEKKIIQNNISTTMRQGNLLVTCIESPRITGIINASGEKPFLSVFFYLDRKIFSELLSENEIKPDVYEALNMEVLPADYLFTETVARLAEIAQQREHAKVMGSLILKELHYLLLSGPYGRILRYLYTWGAKNNSIMETIGWIKQNLGVNLAIPFLAKKANMSVSNFHRHFKAVTGFSPLQYQKELRLYEAQRMMLAENERADIAAIKVGYESSTQFNREYKRKFGLPPHQDIARIRQEGK